MATEAAEVEAMEEEVTGAAVEVAAAPILMADPANTTTGVGAAGVAATDLPRGAEVAVPCGDLTLTEEAVAEVEDMTREVMVVEEVGATAHHRVAHPKGVTEAVEEATTADLHPRGATPPPTAPSPRTPQAEAADLTCTHVGRPDQDQQLDTAVEAGADPLPNRAATMGAATGEATADLRPNKEDTGSSKEDTEEEAGATAAMEDTNLTTCESPIPPLVTKQYCKENEYAKLPTLHTFFCGETCPQKNPFDHLC